MAHRMAHARSGREGSSNEQAAAAPRPMRYSPAMNWRAWSAWRCWFQEHQFVYREVSPDPKNPQASAAVFELARQHFGGHPLALNICRRCGRADGVGPVVPDGIGGTITAEEFLERRYREGVEEVARLVEGQSGEDVKIDVPSLSDEPIPVRDALNILTELDIAASKAERGLISFGCWNCKAPMSVSREHYTKTARCTKCGTKQRTPLT